VREREERPSLFGYHTLLRAETSVNPSGLWLSGGRLTCAQGCGYRGAAAAGGIVATGAHPEEFGARVEAFHLGEAPGRGCGGGKFKHHHWHVEAGVAGGERDIEVRCKACRAVHVHWDINIGLALPLHLALHAHALACMLRHMRRAPAVERHGRPALKLGSCCQFPCGARVCSVAPLSCVATGGPQASAAGVRKDSAATLWLQGAHQRAQQPRQAKDARAVEGCDKDTGRLEVLDAGLGATCSHTLQLPLSVVSTVEEPDVIAHSQHERRSVRSGSHWSGAGA
jgi:hypothetical protein